MSQKTELSLVAINLVNDAFNWVQINRVNNLFFNNTINNINDNNDNNSNNNQSIVVAHTSNHVLGFVALNSLSVKLSDFRQLMSQQIQSLPDNFAFLSKEGWPVSSVQELNLNLYYIINNETSTVMIRRQFEKYRFGVHTMNGVPLGFIFALMEDNAEEIRHLINQQLMVSEEEAYNLIDRNGWPVNRNQEQVIKGWDLVMNGVIRISGIKRPEVRDHEIQETLNLDVTEGAPHISPIRKKKRPSEATTIDLNKASEDSSHTMIPLIPLNSTTTEPSTPNTSTAADPYHPFVIPFHKPILISYVRAEAEQHARQLKSELQDLGCNVFLDVDEIEGGHDWADALNNAVLNCDLFVPLITPNYGYTQWTNREVKLADIKKKSIIPISFLDSWPPECLAIQFASTQYIPWKTTSDIEKSLSKGEGERARDIRFWDQPYVRTTATAIAEHLKIANIEKERMTTQMIPTSNIASLKRTSIESGSAQMLEQVLSNAHLNRPSSLLGVLSVPKRRPLIVISAHPLEKDFAELMRQELSKFGFEVWSSTDMSISSFSSSSDQILTPSMEFSTPTSQTPTQRLDECDQMSDQTLYIGSQNSESSQDSQNLTPNDSNRALIRHKLRFSLSMTDPIAFPHCSQDFMSQTCILSPEDLDKARNFRVKVDAASVVIIILSKSYCNSRTCKQQAFYCDTRKMVIPIKYDDFRSPHWLSKLFDDDEMLEYSPTDLDSFINLLTQRTSKLVTSSRDTFKCAMSEARIASMASYISRQLPIEKKKIMVYIAGSTKFFSPLSEAICRAIGQSLASIPFLVLVTGGVYGAAETTGRSFCEERELLLKEKPANLYHILPKYVSQDSSMKARQNSDGTFQSLPFGHTLFIGDSFKERDSVVARLFNYCIIIEGGPRTARIAEEFMWNDNIVIPIICTGGAAAGQFDLPAKIHDVPLGVHQDDWSTLVRRDVTAENIAEAVKNIIYSLVKCRSRKKTKDKHNSGLRISKVRTSKIKTKT